MTSNRRRPRILWAVLAGLALLVGSCGGLSPERRKQKADAHYRMATAYLQQTGDLQSEVNRRAAFPDLLEAIRLDPKNPEYHRLLGTFYFANREYDMAEREIRTALKIDPNFPEAHNNLGMLFSVQGKFPEAVQEYRIAIANHSYSTPHFARFNLANAAYHLGDYTEAAEAYERYLEIEPNHPEARFFLGMSYARLGRLAEAEKAFTAAVQLQPAASRARYELGMVFFKLNRKEEAAEQFRKVVELDPKSEFGEQSKTYLKLLR